MRIKFNLFFILFIFICLYIGYIEEAAVIFLSVILHELGHVFAARKLKVHVDEMEIFPFGGVARMEDISKYGGLTEALIAIAGPLISLFMFLGFFLFSSQSVYIALYTKYNLVMFAFNILPALPLDGGRIVRNLLLYIMSYKLATRIMIIAGQILAIGFILYNITLILQGSTSIAYLITGIFIFLGALKERKYCSYIYLMNRNNRKMQAIENNKKINMRVINVSEKTYISQVASSFSPISCCTVNVRDSSGRIIKILNEADIMDGLLKYGYDATIGDIIKVSEH